MMPDTISYTSGSDTLHADLYAPNGTASGALVVVVYGTDGLVDNANGPWETMIRDYAATMAARGHAVLLPDYLSKTRTTPGPPVLESLAVHRTQWETALIDAVAHGRTIRGVDPARVGLLGFSLGGHLCLRIRGAAQPKTLSLYFTPLLDGPGPVGHARAAEIHHGDADSVPGTGFPNAPAIERLLTSEGTRTTLHRYPGADHGFAKSDEPNRQARKISKDRTVAFVDAEL
jgi:dienelactone hydrolase